MAHVFKDFDHLLATLELQVAELRQGANRETGRPHHITNGHASGVEGVLNMLKDTFFDEPLSESRLSGRVPKDDE